jgi:hypothetical protein
MTCAPGDESPEPVTVSPTDEQLLDYDEDLLALVVSLDRVESSLAATHDGVSRWPQWPNGPRRPLAPFLPALRKEIGTAKDTLRRTRDNLRTSFSLDMGGPLPAKRSRGRPTSPRRQSLIGDVFAMVQRYGVPLTDDDGGTLARLMRIVLAWADELDGRPRQDRDVLYHSLKRWIQEYREAHPVDPSPNLRRRVRLWHQRFDRRWRFQDGLPPPRRL